MRNVRYANQLLLVALVTLSLFACGAPGNGMSPSGTLPALGPQAAHALVSSIGPHATGKIQHVVIIFQENRSFDNLFQGYPGADTQSWGYRSDGTKVNLEPIGLETTWDIDHSSNSFFAACDGRGPRIPGTECRMDGFDKEWAACYSWCPYANPQYAYVPPAESKPYFNLASQYVLGDRTFASNFDASSFISHQYIIRANASTAVNYPSGEWGCDGGPSDEVARLNSGRQVSSYAPACFDGKTLGDEMDTAHVSWGYYTAALGGDGDLWSAYQAIRHIRYGPDWATHIITPQTQFFTDVHDGNLPSVSWVLPTCETSDHAGCGSNLGPSWVTSLVNAVGNSKYWDSTAVFVMWDDYGGWYDHIPPPFVDYDGLGMRVPLLVISPYAKKGHVSHYRYEHGSILRFIEDQFGLPRLAASDSRALTPETDCFDFTQLPRKFVPFATRLTENDFKRRPLDRRPPDTQ